MERWRVRAFVLCWVPGPISTTDAAADIAAASAASPSCPRPTTPSSGSAYQPTLTHTTKPSRFSMSTKPSYTPGTTPGITLTPVAPIRSIQGPRNLPNTR